MFFLFPVIKSHHVMMTFLVFDLDVLFIKSHHVMMTFLVFDLDVLFIPCYSFFLLSFRRIDCSSISQKLSIESTSNFLCICRTRICSAVQNLSDLGTFCDE